MKKLYISFLFFNNSNSMPFNLHLNDNLLSENKLHTEDEKEKKNKNAKIFYIIGIITSLITLAFTIYNYIIATEGNQKIIGLITSFLQVLISMLYIIFFNFRYIVLKIISSIYLFIIPSLLIIGLIINFENLYGNLSSNYEFNNNTAIILLTGIFTWFFSIVPLFLQYTKLSYAEILCILCCL